MNSKDLYLLALECVAAGNPDSMNEQSIEIIPIEGSHDCTVELCVFHITNETGHAETIDVHHAMFVAEFANALERQNEAVKQCLMKIITDSTRELEETYPGGRDEVQKIRQRLYD